ncbi:MAG: ComEC/Rec2 family competence protein [Dehalococcoidia bacterium]
MDVGQGDAILIRTPAGHKILVDGGPSGEAITTALGRQLPFWDRHLHMVVLTHPQADHLSGLLAVLERYRVDQVLASPAVVESDLFQQWQEAVAEGRVPYQVAARGQWLDLGDDAWLSVLHPPSATFTDADVNNSSVVVKLRWRHIGFILTGDVEAEAEALLTDAADVRATVLKVAHHGSATSTTPTFLRAVRPLVAVISVGADNRFGHPSPQVLERLEDAFLVRTDDNGDVHVSTDGRRLWVEVQRR